MHSRHCAFRQLGGPINYRACVSHGRAHGRARTVTPGYQLETLDARKHRIAEGIVSKAVASGNACISFQVVQECLNTVLRKAKVKLDLASARAYLDTVLTPLYLVPASLVLYQRTLALQARWQFSFYDSLIVAAALEAGCKKLLSEDLQHGQRIEGLRIENPFKAG